MNIFVGRTQYYCQDLKSIKSSKITQTTNINYAFHFSIYTATWNVNGRPCADISLNAWLSESEEPPDIYAIAFQELDLSPKAITFSESRPDPVWM